MINPFSRLKHYLPDAIDPQENHATECLAACMVFSERIRASFIEFLSGGELKLVVDAPSEVEVVTQQSTESGGFIDLVLHQDGKLIVAVEVKVKCLEDDRHRSQLRNYRKWVDDHTGTKGYLFTLVRNPDNAFHPEQFGADGRRTWRALYKFFQEMLGESVGALDGDFLGVALGAVLAGGFAFWATARAGKRTAQMSNRWKRCIVMTDTPETNDGALGL